MNRCTLFLMAVLIVALVGCDSTPPPAQEPSTPKAEPAPPSTEPAPPKAEPAPPKPEPAPPKVEPPKAEPPKPEPPKPEPPKPEPPKPEPPKPEPPKVEPPKPEPPKVEPPKPEPPKADPPKPTTPPALPKHKYMGVTNCKMCHQKDTEGKQFAIWAESKHAQAWKTLGTAAAKKLAAAKGIAGDPQQAPECLKCHVTAFGAPAEFLGPKFDPKEGVQCEACHGPGADYNKKDLMKNREKAMALGLVIPDESLCKTCHNPESPSYKEFKFEEYRAKIAHPVPK